MSKKTRIFTDIDLNFAANPVTKDISRRYDENAIKASVKNLILTSNYERPFHSEIGSQVRALLFDNYSPLFASSMRRAIIDVLDNFEPRVEVIDVIVNARPDNNTVDITITFKIVNTERPLSVFLTLDRTR